MSSSDKIIDFLGLFSKSFEAQALVKCIISKRNKSVSVPFNSILLKPVRLQSGLLLSFIYRFDTKEETKNQTLQEAIAEIQEHLAMDFLQADLFTTAGSSHLMTSKKGKSSLIHKNNAIKQAVNLAHNKTKNWIIPEEPLDFLSILGVFTKEGKLKENRREKFVQINKFLEFFAQLVKEADLKPPFTVIDMGSGKAYLTFAMYHYLHDLLGHPAIVTGVEYRQDMVDLCNGFANTMKMDQLSFVQGSIEDFEMPAEVSVMVALHACDTATDDAIFKAIRAKAKAIMVAPCCHKQVRKDMRLPKEMQHFELNGILKERMAETLTDTIRSLLLEAHGYVTKVFEFVNAGNTPKNLMITARYVSFSQKIHDQKMEEILSLKRHFGIGRHYLEVRLVVS